MPEVRGAHTPAPAVSARADGVFSALADPTRRAVLRSLADEGAATATELASRFPISRQAVSKHLSLLENVGLVEGERAGRELRFRLTPEPLSDAVEWIKAVDAAWTGRLGNLARLVHARHGAAPDHDPGNL